MLSEIYLQDFKSHQETSLQLDESRLHALVGKNGSGKTSILQAIDYFESEFRSQSQETYSVQTLVRSGCSSFVLAMKTLETQQQKTIRRELHCECSDKNAISWKFDLPQDLQNSFQDFKSRVPSSSPVEASSPLSSSIAATASLASFLSLKFSSEVQALRYFLKESGIKLSHPIYLKLDVKNLMKSDYSDVLHPEMKRDGSGIASALGNLRDESLEQFELLQEMMRRVVPGVKRVRIRRASVTVQSLRPIVGEGNQGYRSLSKFLDEENLLGLRVIGQEIVLDMNSGNSIPAHALSEGTLLTLGILTALISPQRPNLILLEDIQQGLHPRAQREIINILKELLQNNEDLQIIFSTHSPYILDALDPSQVHVLTTAKTGFTQTKRLDEHPDAEWAKQTLTTGEFWDSTGEDWVAEA